MGLQSENILRKIGREFLITFFLFDLAEWRVASENHVKRPKMQLLASKVMVSVFWDAHSIIYIDYFENRKSINSYYYIELLARLKDNIAKNWWHMKKKKIVFHRINAPYHKSMKTMAKLNKLGFNLLPHQPYSPDLAPSNYWLFADLKKMLQGKRFGSNEEVLVATEAYFEAKDKSFYTVLKS